MHSGDKATLRLTLGLGLAALIAYGMALTLPYVVCVMAVVLLSKPGPPLPLVKGIIVALALAGLVAAGLVMVPLLENYAIAGILLTAVILFVIFFAGLVSGSPLAMVLVIAFAMMPVAGVIEQALVGMLALTLAVGVAVGTLVGFISSAFFPDRAAPTAAAKPPRPGRAAAAWIALRATLIVMPVFVLALTDPSFYLAAIMKTVTLSQQAGETDARSAGKELVGSTLMGAVVAVGLWFGLSLWPNLWMLVLWMMAAALWVGSAMTGARSFALSPLVLEQRTDHGADPDRPRDRGQRQRQECSRGHRHAHVPLRRRRALCLGNHPAARALASRTVAGSPAQTRIGGETCMILTNFLVGLLVMLVCLAIQAFVTFWCVRYFVRRIRQVKPKPEDYLRAGLRPLLVAMVAMMLGTFVQVSIWGGLFVVLGEFSELYEAVYHSAVNFASLGYGDIVMSKNRKLLGPVEAINGVLMLGMSAAALTVILQQLVKLQYGEDLQAADDEG